MTEEDFNKAIESNIRRYGRLYGEVIKARRAISLMNFGETETILQTALNDYE